MYRNRQQLVNMEILEHDMTFKSEHARDAYLHYMNWINQFHINEEGRLDESEDDEYLERLGL